MVVHFEIIGTAPKPAARLKGWGSSDDEATIKARIELGELKAYVEAIEGVFKEYFASLPPDAGRDVLLDGTIRRDAKVDLPITTTVEGLLDEKVLTPLYQRLFALPVPPVKEGPVGFRAVFALWGGSARRPFGV
jgi:hypothetical protein